jgi:2-methylisocitrate lyase-like PEP mutase family enzyme
VRQEAVHDAPGAEGVSFHSLHVAEPFVIPNPWDAGSARMLEALGFGALATTPGRARRRGDSSEETGDAW